MCNICNEGELIKSVYDGILICNKCFSIEKYYYPSHQHLHRSHERAALTIWTNWSALGSLISSLNLRVRTRPGDGILAQSVQTVEKTLKGQEDARLSAIFEQRKQRRLDLDGTKRAKSVLPSMADLENIPPPKLTMDEFRLCVHNGGFRLASETSSLARRNPRSSWPFSG